ncbi:hypothetical protein MMC13_005925 [Lambiella insularis]|nr:hypothetical protein [Lambiella insularis]
MLSKKLRIPPQAPPRFTNNPISIVEDAKHLIERSCKVQDQITQNVQPDAATFSSVLLPLARAENVMQVESHILGFYKDISSDPKLRDASSEAQELLDNFSLEAAMREDLYHLVDAVLRKKEHLDPECAQLLQKQHKGYIRNGLRLPAGHKRARFEEIQKRLIQLRIEFRRNQNEDDGSILFLSYELDGIPEDVLSELERGTGEEEGKLRLTLQYPQSFATQKHAKNSETRKRCYIAAENKCDENVPIFQEIMVLRDEAARLLGYPNHAAFSIEEKMAKNPETVDVFLEDLRSRLTTGGRNELENLKQLKKADLESQGQPFDGRIFHWDLEFYKEVMLETQYSVDEQKIAEYFPLQTTISGMLSIFQHLFGLDFVEIAGDEKNTLNASRKDSDIVWHEDVQVFSVWDNEEQSGGFLGYLYLDLFPREAKYGQVANFNLQPGFLREDGTRQYPATALVCNFTKPTSNKPSLLKHNEIVLLFHELGHGIHDLVSKTTYARFHGTITAVDFGEAPSQMLENWCWMAPILKSLSRHYSFLSPQYHNSWKEQAHGEAQPPEQIPDDMIEGLTRAKHVNGALYYLRLLHVSIFDMMIHEPASHEAIKSMNISAAYNKLRKALTQIDGPEELGQGDEWGHGHADLGHVIDEYDAGVYAYLSKVFADDMFFAVFKPDPMNAIEGRRYRHAVLEKGGSQDEMKTVVDFLGREPSAEAFYKELGLE